MLLCLMLLLLLLLFFKYCLFQCWDSLWSVVISPLFIADVLQWDVQCYSEHRTLCESIVSASLNVILSQVYCCYRHTSSKRTLILELILGEKKTILIKYLHYSLYCCLTFTFFYSSLDNMVIEYDWVMIRLITKFICSCFFVLYILSPEYWIHINSKQTCMHTTRKHI